METNNFKVEYKSSELIAILSKNYAGKMNLARIKFFGLFIVALCKLQTVNFEKLATGFETPAKTASSLRRIQRFIAEYVPDTGLIARLIVKLLPHKPPCWLIMDRTNWKFGESNINVLTLAVAYRGVAFPLMLSMLDKRGNSNTKERIALVDKYVDLFGKATIECLLAYREFVGENWIKYLNDNGIRYHVRIRENFWVEYPRNGKRVKARWMFNDVKCGEEKFLYRVYRVNGQFCYLSAAGMKNKEGEPELQIIISFNQPEQALRCYKERWQIETAFRALKSSGFHIEDTHLIKPERVEKLFSLVMVAFAWACVVGIYVHENLQAIKVKKHGRWAKSLFKCGLQTIANVLLNPLAKPELNIFEFLSCT